MKIILMTLIGLTAGSYVYSDYAENKHYAQSQKVLNLALESLEIRTYIERCPALSELEPFFKELHSLAVLNLAPELKEEYASRSVELSNSAQKEIRRSLFDHPLQCVVAKDLIEDATKFKIFQLANLLSREFSDSSGLPVEDRFELAVPTVGTYRTELTLMKNVLLCQLNKYNMDRKAICAQFRQD